MVASGRETRTLSIDQHIDADRFFQLFVQPFRKKECPRPTNSMTQHRRLFPQKKNREQARGCLRI
jgi:hypothetical protein